MADIVGKMRNLFFGNPYKTMFVVLPPFIFAGIFYTMKPYRDGFVQRETERGHLPKE